MSKKTRAKGPYGYDDRGDLTINGESVAGLLPPLENWYSALRAENAMYAKIYHDRCSPFATGLVKGGVEPALAEEVRQALDAEFVLDDDMIGWEARSKTVHYSSWAVPSAELLNFIIEFSPLIEVGAGTGFLARLLKIGGADVIATDKYPPNSRHNGYFIEEAVCFTDVLMMDAKAAAAAHPDRTLLLVWPPYKNTMSYQALRAHRAAGGKKVVYVGESAGNCTGSPGFFKTLVAHYAPIRMERIPTWPMVHDAAYAFVRTDSLPREFKIEDLEEMI